MQHRHNGNCYDVVETLPATIKTSGYHQIANLTTAQGLPGLSEVCAISSSVEDIALSMLALLADDALWRERSRSGAAYARARFSREAMASTLRGALGMVEVAPA